MRDVEIVVAKIARIPPKSISRDDKKSLLNLDDLGASRSGKSEKSDCVANYHITFQIQVLPH